MPDESDGEADPHGERSPGDERGEASFDWQRSPTVYALCESRRTLEASPNSDSYGPEGGIGVGVGMGVGMGVGTEVGRGVGVGSGVG